MGKFVQQSDQLRDGRETDRARHRTDIHDHVGVLRQLFAPCHGRPRVARSDVAVPRAAHLDVDFRQPGAEGSCESRRIGFDFLPCVIRVSLAVAVAKNPAMERFHLSQLEDAAWDGDSAGVEATADQKQKLA